jgi:predicted TIM-barrel enzyme
MVTRNLRRWLRKFTFHSVETINTSGACRKNIVRFERLCTGVRVSMRAMKQMRFLQTVSQNRRQLFLIILRGHGTIFAIRTSHEDVCQTM